MNTIIIFMVAGTMVNREYDRKKKNKVLNILQHVNPLLGNDRKVSNYTTAIAK
jgi:hypothetical protein